MSEGKYVGVQDGKIIFAPADTDAAEQKRRADLCPDLVTALEKARAELYNAQYLDGLHSFRLGPDGASARAVEKVAYIDTALARAKEGAKG